MNALTRWWFQSDDDALARPFRWVFFSLLAWDAWSQISHLSRYGAGGFNVSHLPAGLDRMIPAPEPQWIIALTLIQLACAALVVFRVALRPALLGLTLSYGTTYLWSQLDSYQHHYLMLVLLVLITGAVWIDKREDLPGWSLRLVRVQMSIVYAWTVVAKLDPLWFQGEVLRRLTTPEWAKEMVASVAGSAGVEELTVFGWMAIAVVLVEAFLAVGLHVPKLRWPVLIVGIALHAGIELLEFKIGNFSYLMMGLYLLVLPPQLGRTLGRWPREPLVELGAWVGPVAGGLVALAVLALPFDAHRWLLAAAVGGAVTAVTWRHRRGSTLAGALAAGALLTVFHAQTDQVRDYYRYMGGDGRARGDHQRALDGYEQVVRIDPDYFSSRVRLGDLYMRQGRFEEALEQFEHAQRIEPDNSTVVERLERANQALEQSP